MEHFRLIELLNILFPCETGYCTGKWKDINPAGNALCVNLRPAAKKEQAQPESKKSFCPLRERSFACTSYCWMMLPSVSTMVMFHGIIFPQFLSASIAACAMPPQHGTDMRTTDTLLISFCFRISVSFSA